MRRLIKQLMLGKNNIVSGVIALGIVSAIAMGCTCGKNFDLANLANEKETNRTTVTNTATPETKPDDSTLSDESRGDVPSERDMEDLVKTTLLDFNDAIQQGDFTDFHSKIAKVWKTTTTPEALNQGFNVFILSKTDLSGIKNLNATFDPEPKVEKRGGNKVLKANGRYDTYPLPTKFENEYLMEGGKWKLIGIRISTKN